MEKAIFIGTQLIPGGHEFLSTLKKTGFKLIGLIGHARNFDSTIDSYYYCEHFGEDCDCKMPRAGLLFDATKDLNLDLNHSWLIGQTLDEIEAANRAGCNNILVANGAETQWNVTPIRQPQFISPCLEYAVGTVVLKSIYQMVREQQV